MYLGCEIVKYITWNYTYDAEYLINDSSVIYRKSFMTYSELVIAEDDNDDNICHDDTVIYFSYVLNFTENVPGDGVLGATKKYYSTR